MSVDVQNLANAGAKIVNTKKEDNRPLRVTPIKKNGLFNWNFDKVDDFIRTVSFNSPLVKMGLLGTAGYFGGRALAPWVTRILSPNVPGVTKDKNGKPVDTVDSWETMSDEEKEETKSTHGWIAAGLLAAPTLLFNLNFKKPFWGLGQFPDKHLEKNNSAWAINSQPFESTPTLPVNYARDVIMSTPDLNPSTKATALGILDAFPSNAQVSSPSIIDKAISTGIDAAKGGALGFVTAKALGLPNPMVTAGIFAGINTILR